MNPNEQLGYTSSAPDFNFAPVDTVKPEDEADAPALKRIFTVIAERKAYYGSTNYLALGDITLENQLIIAKQMQLHLQELESLISSTLIKVKDKQDANR